MVPDASIRYGICRACGARILWLKTTKGKSMPCDPGAIRFTPGGGPETFVTVDGKVVRGKRGNAGETYGHISHFATCPQADRFRKKSNQQDDYDQHRFSGLISEE